MGIDYDIQILVVDDSRMMRSLIRRYLINSGFPNIDQAADGREGITMMQKKSYDLITLDVVMPGMDGMEFLATVRQFDHFDDVMVMMVTVTADRKLILNLIEMGANEYILKPFSNDTFTQKVCYLMENRHRTKEDILADLEEEEADCELLMAQEPLPLSVKKTPAEAQGDQPAPFCSECGIKSKEKSNFCYNCGSSLVVKA
ncbi:MAG: response regulator [Desulfobacterium sp.]|nr:response regulator [Desulfobacterium sp.]